MQFLDEAKIYVQSGKGGDGCISFRREKFVAYGGPNGGHGGKGGDVIVRSVPSLNTLIDYRYQQHFRAKNGQHGMGSNRHGKSAADTILQVPVGTQIFDETGQFCLADFTEPGQEIVLLEGGRGGAGNSAFKSSTNQTPRTNTDGQPAKEMWIWLRLKIISDAALVGLPNAGKSTFLSKVTAARPKIADYPFTTLKPQLGVARYGDYEFVIADIPGLIEGAHAGAGLGDRFLKHIERAGVIIHLVDGSSDNYLESYRVIRKELELYSTELATRLEVIGLTKCDSLVPEMIEERINELKQIARPGSSIVPISSLSGFNLPTFLGEVYKVLEPMLDEERRVVI